MLKHIENLRQCSYSQPSISNDFRFSFCHLIQCLHQTGRVAWPLTGTITDKLTYAHHFRSKLFLSFSDFFCHELNHPCLCMYYVQFSIWYDSHFQCQVFSLFLSIKNFLCDRKVPCAALGRVLICSVCYSTATHFKALIWLH